jgi:hypothetical protein
MHHIRQAFLSDVFGTRLTRHGCCDNTYDRSSMAPKTARKKIGLAILPVASRERVVSRRKNVLMEAS